jgi:putative transposase
MPRISRVVVPNYPHHVTQRGTNKSAIFIDDEDRVYFLTLLDQWAGKSGSKVWAYCLMNNHFHLLVAPDGIGGLGKFLHGLTFRYAQYFNKKYSRTGRLWQNRYFSCTVDKDEYVWTATKYIEMNPVRAGIVKKPEAWRWSSALAHMKAKGDCDISLYEWLSDGERKGYVDFLVASSDEERIRKATSTGRPFCGERFFKKLTTILNRDLKPKKGGRPRKKKL